MQIVPSIDLLAGKCVRLLKGDYGQSTVYSDDPVETAMGFGRRIEGVEGIVIIIGDQIGFWGEIEVVPLKTKKG